MFQAIQVEAESEQQGLTHLRAQRLTRGPSREFSFDRREQALDQGAATVKPSWESISHLGAHSMHAPSFLSAFGGNQALCSKALADVSMIALAIKLRVGQHQSDADLLGSCFDDRRQIRAVVPRTAPRELRQHELLIEDWIFREAEARLSEHRELRQLLGLASVPDFTTLYRFL